MAEAYADYGLLARPGVLPAANSVARSLPATVVSALALIGFVLLLTPTGSLPSPRWHWWAWVAAAVLVTYQVAFAVTNLAVVVAAGSLVVRFRRAQGVERQQLRWVSLAAVVIIAALAIGAPVLVGWVAGICVATLPLAIAAAILRYRLYDLDRIVSRALAYGLLTVLLGGGYAGVVLGLGQLLGRASSLAVAGATLAVAAVFQPARRRVQRAVDRRFNRRRYDAAQTIQAFSARLRQQVDLEVLTTELLGVVEQTMQPTQVSLWLRPTVPVAPSGVPTATAASRR